MLYFIWHTHIDITQITIAEVFGQIFYIFYIFFCSYSQDIYWIQLSYSFHIEFLYRLSSHMLYKEFVCSNYSFSNLSFFLNLIFDLPQYNGHQEKVVYYTIGGVKDGQNEAYCIPQRVQA